MLSKYTVSLSAIGVLGLGSLAGCLGYGSSEIELEKRTAITLTRAAAYPSQGYYIFGNQLGPSDNPTSGSGHAIECKGTLPTRERLTLWSDIWEGKAGYLRVSLQLNNPLKIESEQIETYYFDKYGRPTTPTGTLDPQSLFLDARAKLSTIEKDHPARPCIDSLIPKQK